MFPGCARRPIPKTPSSSRPPPSTSSASCGPSASARRCNKAHGDGEQDRSGAGRRGSHRPPAGGCASYPDMFPPTTSSACSARVMSACPAGLRDRAILLLLARLALRAGDIVRLRLSESGLGERTRGVCGSPMSSPVSPELPSTRVHELLPWGWNAAPEPHPGRIGRLLPHAASSNPSDPRERTSRPVALIRQIYYLCYIDKKDIFVLFIVRSAR